MARRLSPFSIRSLQTYKWPSLFLSAQSCWQPKLWIVFPFQVWQLLLVRLVLPLPMLLVVLPLVLILLLELTLQLLASPLGWRHC